ncbi:MAG TPA: MlaD family protein [Verrucomicrobiae bacterium]
MALQDLTPQLRTRLSRMERAVGWFVFLATALLLFGFGYYLYQKAQQKGWFVIKAKFHTYIKSSTGLNIGDPVVMMGFSVGQILSVHPMQPRDPHNVEVVFELRDPYFRYIWSQGSLVKVNAADFLGKRQIEITRGTNGYAICITQPISVFTNLDELKQLAVSQPNQWQLSQDIFDENSNLVFGAYTTLDATNLQRISELGHGPVSAYNNTEKDKNHIVASWHPRDHRYEEFTPARDAAWLKAVESPAITEQLQAMVSQVQAALPGILSLTNKIAAVLDNTANATSNLNVTISAAQPLLTNFTLISAQLREPGGVLNWALGTNGGDQFQGVLTNANSLLAHTDTNLNTLVISLGQSLNNLSDITSNLNMQVQENPNLLFGIVKTIGDADDFVQGLKHHWLLRSAFKKENEAEAAKEKH